MSTTTIDRTDALVERLFTSTIGALELFSVYLGTELGLYQGLTAEPATAQQLAVRAGIAERYAREWLEQQAVAGLIEVQEARERRYALPADHARVLASPDDAAHIAPFAHMLAGIGGVLPQVAHAYRTGGGVPYGAAFRHGHTCHTAEAGLDGRVRFLHADATELAGPYDLILILETLHDLTRPADTFTAPGDEVERMMYGWSVTHCLPTQMVEQPSAALGTVMRSDTVCELATEAGYARVDVLPVENDLFRLYRLHP